MRSCDFCQKLLEILSLEQSVSIGWVPVHREFATCCPFANGVLSNAQVLRCFCGLEVFGKFSHGMRSPCVCVNFDRKAVYQSLHQLTIIPPILGSATLVTRNKSWELPTNCRKTMLELVRIFELNVCHRRDDIEPEYSETMRWPRARSQSTTLRLPTRTFIWRPKPRHPHWFPTCQRLIRVPLTRSNSAAPRTDDIVSVALEPDRSSGLCGGFPWVRKQRHAT